MIGHGRPETIQAYREKPEQPEELVDLMKKILREFKSAETPLFQDDP